MAIHTCTSGVSGRGIYCRACAGRRKRAPRDSQRKRVYAAEYDAFKGTDAACILTLDGAQALAEEAAAFLGFQRPTVKRGKGRNGGAYANPYRNEITLHPGAGFVAWIVLHEVSHLSPATRDYIEAAHGPEFCARHLALTRHFFGRDMAAALARAYHAKRVKVAA